MTMVLGTEELRAAVISARVAVLNAEVLSMNTANMDRLANGFTIAYDEAAFMEAVLRNGVDKNSIARIVLHGEMP